MPLREPIPIDREAERQKGGKAERVEQGKGLTVNGERKIKQNPFKHYTLNIPPYTLNTKHVFAPVPIPINRDGNRDCVFA